MNLKLTLGPMLLGFSLLAPSAGVAKCKNCEDKEKKHEHHREHKAHQHGHGTLAIAFEGANGTVEFLAPAESVLGFEHQAKSEKELQKAAEAKKSFETEIGNWIKFDEKLGCKWIAKSVQQTDEEECACGDSCPGPEKCPHHKDEKHKKGEHSDWKAQYEVACQSAPKGSEVTVDFSSLKKLKELEISVIADDVQTSATAKKKSVKISLK